MTPLYRQSDLLREQALIWTAVAAATLITWQLYEWFGT